MYLLLFLVILLSFIFTYTNGFQDGSSVTASAIGCRSLSPRQAVILVAAMELCGALLGGQAVADTMQSISSWPHRPDLLPIVICGLLGAIIWNFAMRFSGLPSSSTHALVGGILGALIAASDSLAYVVWGHIYSPFHGTGMSKVLLALFMAPVLGFAGGYVLLLLSKILLSRASIRINRQIKALQWLTLSILAFGHGANDTQKSMGLILLCLNSLQLLDSYQVPGWLRLLTGLCMSAGVIALAPGIVKKVGSRIYRLRPLHGLVTQISAAGILLTASLNGGPVSASQVVSSSVMGAGAADRLKGVQWLIAQEMLTAWCLTIPGAGVLAWISYHLLGAGLNHIL